MKHLSAVILAAFVLSTAAHSELPRPKAARTDGGVQSTVPAQVDLPISTAQEPPKQVGGTVTAPVLVKRVEAKFTDAARKSKVNGSVLVRMTLETDGTPSHVHVIKSLGYGLDETAVDAITEYRFKPAMKDGTPVRVEMNVDVHFKVFKRFLLF